MQVRFPPGALIPESGTAYAAVPNNMQKPIVAVIGGRRCTEEVEQIAHLLGKKLQKVVDVLVCGGLSGVM